MTFASYAFTFLLRLSAKRLAYDVPRGVVMMRSAQIGPLLLRLRWPLTLAFASSLTAIAVREWQPAAHACGVVIPWWKLSSNDGHVFANSRILKLYHGGSRAMTGGTVVVTLQEMAPAAGRAPVPLKIRAATNPAIVELELGDTALVAGAHYALDVSATWSTGEQSTNRLEFDAVAPPPPPASLGVLRFVGRESGWLPYPVCSNAARAKAGVQLSMALSPSEEAKPWLRAMAHQVMVDDEPIFTGELPLVDFAGNDSTLNLLIYTTCEGARIDGLGVSDGFVKSVPGAFSFERPAGTATYVWTATLPDGTKLETAPLEIELPCVPELDESDADAAAIDDSEAGRLPVSATGASTDDATTSPAAVTSSSTSASEDTDVRRHQSEGCALRTPRDRARAVPLASILMSLALITTRRWRRRATVGP